MVKWLGKTNYKQLQLRENSCNESQKCEYGCGIFLKERTAAESNQKMGKKTGGSLCFLHYNKSRSPLDRARVK